MATAEEIKTLREETGLSIMQCKKALEAAKGDKDKALTLLEKEGESIAEKKSGRDLGAGTISSYVHTNGNVGAMITLLCETDFVSKNPEFQKLAYEIAMQVSAMEPEDTEALLAQPYIKDSKKTIQDLINTATQKFGERTEVGRFARFTLN